MNRHVTLALSASALGTLLLQPVTAMADPPAHARNDQSAQYRGYAEPQQRYDDDRDERRGYDPRDDRWDDRRDERGDFDRRRWESHDYYPRRGYVVQRLPPGPHVVRYQGQSYYYGRGGWYRPYRTGYVVVDPPVGLVVPFLPGYSTTLYFGGIPHYRAGPVYYVWNPRARGYMVLDRPYRGW